MIYGLYVIFDKVSGQFTIPQVFINDKSALRYYKDFCKNEKAFPKDTALYKVGLFDFRDAKIKGFDEKIFLSDYIESEVDDNGKN